VSCAITIHISIVPFVDANSAISTDLTEALIRLVYERIHRREKLAAKLRFKYRSQMRLDIESETQQVHVSGRYCCDNILSEEP
jgi:hypothetical protein